MVCYFLDIRVNFTQINYVRLCPQRFTKDKVTHIFGKFVNSAVWVLNVTEQQSVRGTRLGAGWLDIPISQITAVPTCVQFPASDPLHTKRAFLHNPSTPNRHIGVELITKGFRPYWFPPIEKANMIWTVILAKSRPYTSVINLNVQSLNIMICSEHRANRLTRSVVAMLAEYGKESSLNVRKFAFPISFNPNPFKGTPLLEMRFRVDWYVVFCLTCNDASLTAGAPVHINYHLPFSFFRGSDHL